MPRGGKRPGAGRRAGSRNHTTLDKEAARDHVRQRVMAELDPLLDAQLANATGIAHFFLRDENGRFVQITDDKAIETALNSGDEGSYYWIHTKDPSIQAFTDLMNRALDKPKEQPQELDVHLKGEVALVERLTRARKRVKG
jgi:hypothetical protein